ncbi:hypothetical protein ACFLYO_06020 [Chloroflexota bacterium]
MNNLAVIRQRQWTDEELAQAGFTYYNRQKQLVLARKLPAAEAPKIIQASWATLTAEAGMIICYNPKTYAAMSSLDDYDHWPVQPEIFAQDYAPWDDPERTSTPAEIHLIKAGCNPYYKKAGAWARQLTEPTYVQSLESQEPVQYPPGAWLCIGSKGEPWAQDDNAFRSRYIINDDA